MKSPGIRPLLTLAVALLLAGCGQEQDGVPAAAMPSVETITTTPRALAISSELPGRIEPVRVAEVRARVAGIVLKRHFEEGAEVKAGQVLFQIDPAPFKAVLAKAQGELARAEASLFEAEARVRRYTPLVRIEAVSQQDFDAAQAALRSARAARQSAAAEVETARLDLGYATVSAPISGRIGRALVTEGALVGQNEATPLALIQQLDPIYADFRQPVADLLNLREALAEGRLSGENGQDVPLRVSVEGTRHTREGRLLFSDITVDRGTGQVSLRGLLDNPDGLLLPGMYVRVRIEQGNDPQAILVPQRAVRIATDGKPQVLVVGADGLVATRTVRTGAMHGADWHILDGLRAGERVIVGGQANPGDSVNVAPAANAARD